MKISRKKFVPLQAHLVKTETIMTINDLKVIIEGDETRTLEMKKTTGELKDGMPSHSHSS